MTTKVKARRASRALTSSKPSYQTPGQPTRRHSAFYPVIGDGGQALRTLEADCWLENHLSSFEAGKQAIHAYFLKIEEGFIAERAAYDFPGTYDQTLLTIVRNSAAGMLLARARQEFHEFILARKDMPVELPPVPKSDTEIWLDSIIEQVKGGGSRG